MREKISNGCCGDYWPSDMLFEGPNNKYYCAYCLGFDPLKNQPENNSFSLEKVLELFLENLGKESKNANVA